MLSLFGDELPDAPPPKKTGQAKGYAAKPGTGPEGETCGTCKFIRTKDMAKRYHKCWHNRHNWTSGPGSDIRVRSPACGMWRPMEPQEPIEPQEQEEETPS